MSSHLVFNEVDDAVKARLESYWAQKLPRLQKLLVHYREDLREVRLTVSRHPHNGQRSWYEVRGVIHLPTGTLAAEAEDKEPQAAIDRVADELVKEIKRHKELVRKDYLFKRKTRRRADLGAAGPLLEKDAGKGRREDFYGLLRPLLGFLRDHARRELRRLERDGTLHRGEVTEDDLLNEVLLRAWQRFANRPRKLSLELWLTDLLDEVLEEWIKEEPRPHASLETEVKEVPHYKEPGPDNQEWWGEWPSYQETFALEDLIPGWEGPEGWDERVEEQQRDRQLSLLNELPEGQRQTFLLHALEGYATDEIAMLQDRPESEVKADIEAARRTLRERLLAGGQRQEAGRPATAAGASPG